MFQKIILAVIVVVVVAGCSSNAAPTMSTPSSTTPLKVTPPWKGNEHFEYNIVKDSDNSAVGTGVVDVQPAGDATTIEQRYQFGQVTQHFIVKVDPQTLKPIVNTQELTGSPNDYSLTATYAENKLTVTAKTAQGDKSTTIEVAPDAYDNDSLLAILRGLPFTVRTPATFMNVVSANATQIKSTVTISDTESVTVPAGTFNTYPVAMNFGGVQKQTVWYEVADPHRMIKYDNGTTQFVLVK